MKTYEQRTADVSARMKRIKRKRATVTATCLSVVVVILALVLFVPYNTNPPSVAGYANSPYYGLIQKINAATYTKPAYANNFEALMSSVNRFAPGATGSIMNGGAMDAPTADMWFEAEELGEYVEVTDNQVSGVIEGDIFKRSTEYVFYLRDTEVSVYSIAGEDSQLVGSYTVAESMKAEIAEGEHYYYYDSAELYLSMDCTVLTLVLDGYHSDIGSCTTLVSLDVTDPAHITETNRVYITGSYLSSRMVDGKLLLMSKYRVSYSKDFSDESTFLPQTGTPGAMESVNADDILAPDTLSNVYYTVVCAIDEKSLEINDTAAFLSYSDDIYVSNENIYASRSYTQKKEDGCSRTVTEISCLNYSGETLEYLGSVTVAGSIKDQYSMDEYDGILRVVTSTNETVVETNVENAFARIVRNVSLYCVSLEDFTIVASVEEFAPENETAESVRFDGSMAYVCTAEIITLTDPVYFFDLSDLENITWTDTGTIDGYSTSLIQLGDGYLLGIGYGDSWNLKIEVYEEYKDSVISVCAYELEANFSEEYKSYLIDRENNLIGLAVNYWTGETEYQLLHFDGYELNLIAKTVYGGNAGNVRAFIADGWLYVLSSDFAVTKVW